MMQNSPRRLLEGIAQALRHSVLPVLEDASLGGEIEMVADSLEQLAGQVVWRGDVLEHRLLKVRALLACAAERLPAHELSGARRFRAADRADVAESWPAALAALAELQRCLAQPDLHDLQLRIQLDALLASEMRHESELLRSGMYRSRRGDS